MPRAPTAVSIMIDAIIKLLVVDGLDVTAVNRSKRSSMLVRNRVVIPRPIGFTSGGEAFGVKRLHVRPGLPLENAT